MSKGTVMHREFQGLGNNLSCRLQRCTLVFVLLFSAGSAFAQSIPSTAERSASAIDEAAREMGGDARLNGIPREKRKDAVEFVVDNMLFVLFHEMAHVHVTERGLPVLGREEDAADAFATLAMLKIGSDFSHNVLLLSTKAWFLSAEQGEKKSNLLVFYDEHGLDRQRAYQIVCLMVGSDPDKFADLANQVKMPEERQGSCAGDYSNASWSWDTALKSHRRTDEQSKIKIEAVYGEGKGELDVYSRLFPAVRLLEAVADRAAEEYVWRAPFTLEMRSCGRPDAHWNLPAHRLVLCYEMAEELVRLYRDETVDRRPSSRIAANDLIARNIKKLGARTGLAMEDLGAAARSAQSRVTQMARGADSQFVTESDQLAYALNTRTPDSRPQSTPPGIVLGAAGLATRFMPARP